MQTVTHFFLHGNPLLIYLIVAVVLMLESSGVPIANTTLLLLTGAMASFGHANICCLGISAFLGSLTGALVAYALGLRGGSRVLMKVAAVFHIDEGKVRMVERWFSTSGVWMIFLTRMTPYVRPFACFPAGISKMPLPHFLLSAGSGSALWCVVVLSAGWYLGRRWEQALHLIQAYTLPALGVLAILIVVYICLSLVVKRIIRARLQDSSHESCEAKQQKRHDMLKI